MSFIDAMLFDMDYMSRMCDRAMGQMGGHDMMGSMMRNPFDMFRSMDPFSPPQLAIGMGGRQQMMPTRTNALMPFDFGDFQPNRLLMGHSNMPTDGMSFSSSSFVSMTQGFDGRQQVYKATSSTKSGPGGIREMKKTVEDSRTGLKKMAVEHHIGERAHVIEKKKNTYTGEEEEREDLINLDEEETEDFEKEFQIKGRQIAGGSAWQSGRLQLGGGPSHTGQLALPAPPSAGIQPNQIVSLDDSSDEEEDDDDDEPKIVDITPLPSTSSQQQQQQQSRQQHQDEIIEVNQQPQVVNVSTPPRVRGLSGRTIRNNVSSRRPLHILSSSPLAVASSTSTSRATTATSVHPHPYNSNARRHQHRAMKGMYNHHQQPQNPSGSQ